MKKPIEIIVIQTSPTTSSAYVSLLGGKIFILWGIYRLPSRLFWVMKGKLYTYIKLELLKPW